MAARVEEELKAQGIPFGQVEQGIMIETPAAVIISDLLAQEVDFFSIGTNDLTQYTLAIDRQNARLDNIYDAHHPAVLRMIRTVIENGHQGGCWVGICGELGADQSLTETFLRMGIDELSVTPAAVLPIRKIIREDRSGNRKVNTGNRGNAAAGRCQGNRTPVRCCMFCGKGGILTGKFSDCKNPSPCPAVSPATREEVQKIRSQANLSR